MSVKSLIPGLFFSDIVNINLLLTNTLIVVAEYAGLNLIALLRNNWISMPKKPIYI